MISLEKLGYLTLTKSAEYLGVSRQTIYRWKEMDLLPKPDLQAKGLVLWKISSIEKVRKILGVRNANGKHEDFLERGKKKLFKK
jgi:predicted DNA-binding transcriptional regulator AlpA